MYKLLSRKLLGERYRGIIQGIMIAGVMAGGLSGLDVKFSMAQSVILLEAMIPTAEDAWIGITHRIRNWQNS